MSSARARAGILTFLIADVRGYTSFTQSRGDEAAAKLAAKFAEIAREGVEARGGEVIELRGDEALAVFTSARDALRAAVELQLVFVDEYRLDATLPVRVGMGLDAGEAVPVDGGYRGGALNLAARLCSQARAGEVLVSEGLTHLARAVDGIELHDHGEVELKGLSAPVRVLRAAPEGIDPDALALRFEADGQAPPRASELPPVLDPVTPMIGREAEVRRLRWAWRSARRGEGSVLFVVGQTGIGKTRLAAEVAATAAENGATVAYSSFADSSPRAAGLLGGHAALVVLDDLDSAAGDEWEAALELAAEAAGAPRLVVCVFNDERAAPELSAAARRLAREGSFVRPQPLDLDEIRRIAELYFGAAVDTMPPGLLESSGGVPQRVHEQVSDWAHAEAARRLGTYASEAAVGRSGLRSVEESLASSVVDLQFVQEQARLFGAGPGRAAPEADEAPYKGLASFEPTDADRFFGRERLIAELIARLAGSTFLGVVGPSGSGKSSVVKAGLVPALAAGVFPGSEAWTVCVMRPGEHPLRELDRTLFGELPKPLLERIGGVDLPLRAVRDVLGPNERVVLVVDQFEEAFTVCGDEGERAAFLAALTEAAGDSRRKVVIVLALRADYYGRCAADPVLADLLGANTVLVGPLSAEEFRRVIEQPALSVGARIEPVLVDRLVHEVVGEPGSLPLLSTSLLELWERREGRTISLTAYASTGGVHGAVARLAEDAHGGLSEEQQPLVRAILLRLAGPGEGRSVVRRRVPLSEFDAERNEDVAQVLNVLTARRLVTVSDGAVEVSHEALLREWPRFQEWLEEDREGRRLHAHLAETAREWSERGRDPAELYRGARLSSALDWTTEHTLELNELEREFVSTSRAEHERELTRQRRQNRRLKGLLAGVGVLLVLAVVAGALALGARGRAKHSATVALARQLGAVAVSEPRIDTAMLLARESVNLSRSTETEGTLLATLLRNPTAVATFSTPIDSRPLGMALSPDDRTLAVSDNAGNVRFYDTAARRLRRTVHDLGFTAPVAYTPDGSTMVAYGSGAKFPAVDVVDARTLEVLRQMQYDGRRNRFWLTPTGLAMETPLAVSPDGRTVYYAYSGYRPDGSVGRAFLDRWSLRTGKLLSVTPVGADGASDLSVVDNGRRLIVLGTTKATLIDAQSLKPVRTIAYPRGRQITAGAISNDGSTVAVGSDLGSVFFVDAGTGDATQGLGGHSATVEQMAFSADGGKLVTTGDDGTVIVWDARDARPLQRLTAHGGRVNGLAMSAHGQTFYTSSLDGAVFGWDLGTTRRFGAPFTAGAGASPFLPGGNPDLPPEPPLAVSPDGSRFAVRVGPSNVALLSTLDRKRISQFPVAAGGAVTGFVWTGSHALAVIGLSGTAQLWDVSGRPRLVRSLKGLGSVNGQPEGVESVASSPDSRLVAAGDVNHTPGTTPYRLGTVAVWDVGSGKLLWKATSKRGKVYSVAFSPDGTRIAAGYENGEVVLFSAANGHLERTIHIRGGGDFTYETLAFSSDGTLATGSWAGIVQLWNPATGRQIGHATLTTEAPVSSIAFDPSGEHFTTTGGSDGLAKIWTTKTQRQFGTTFPGNPGQWGNAVYMPDGSKLVVLYADGTGFVWPTAVSDWEDHACAVAGRNLTREEWSRFVSGHSYESICPGFPAG